MPVEAGLSLRRINFIFAIRGKAKQSQVRIFLWKTYAYRPLQTATLLWVREKLAAAATVHLLHQKAAVSMDTY